MTHVDGLARIFPSVDVGENCVLEEFVLLGKPHRTVRFGEHRPPGERRPRTSLGARCYIQTGAIIYAGASLGTDVIVTDYCSVGPGTSVGDRTKLQYRALLHHDSVIGSDCRVGGFVCNKARIDSGVSMYGSLVHHYSGHSENRLAGAPVIRAGSIVGFGAVIVGSVTVGRCVYIAAGAIVTRDVPDDSIVMGANTIFSREEWHGRLGGTRAS